MEPCQTRTNLWQIFLSTENLFWHILNWEYLGIIAPQEGSWIYPWCLCHVPTISQTNSRPLVIMMQMLDTIQCVASSVWPNLTLSDSTSDTGTHIKNDLSSYSHEGGISYNLFNSGASINCSAVHQVASGCPDSSIHCPWDFFSISLCLCWHLNKDK